MNDYELLYLIGERNDDAYLALVNKYKPLIYKKISNFKIVYSQRQDFFQEGLLALNTAVQKFNPSYSKTFTRFFEMVLIRRFAQILNKLNKPIIYLDSLTQKYDTVQEDSYEYGDDFKYIFQKLNDIEKTIFESYFLKDQKLTSVAESLSLPIKKVYNTVYRIKQKSKATIKELRKSLHP